MLRYQSNIYCKHLLQRNKETTELAKHLLQSEKLFFFFKSYTKVCATWTQICLSKLSCWKNLEYNIMKKGVVSGAQDWVVTYQISKTSEAHLVKGWKWPTSNEVAVKVVEETRKPPDHDLMVCPSFHELSQHKLVMLFSQGGQNLR